MHGARIARLCGGLALFAAGVVAVRYGVLVGEGKILLDIGVAPGAIATSGVIAGPLLVLFGLFILLTATTSRTASAS